MSTKPNSPKTAFDPADLTPIPGDDMPLRAPMREDKELSSRELAAKRMAELRGHVDGMLGDETPDRFHIDQSIIPEGWDYQWKRHTLLNQEDPTYQVALAQNGWTPVPAGRHPHLMPIGTPVDAPVLRDGNILMERPLEMTELVRAADARRARSQVRIKEQQLNEAPGPGQFERTNKGNPLASVKKGYEQVKIPE